MTGLSKKIIIADSLSVIANRCFITTDLSVLMAWAGAVAYTLQIYFDFSGYTDFVIGLGNLFGFNLPENFNYPYMANSISDFWKRWHISLTKWFTKYIYIPLGGSRVKTVFRHIFNLFVVWFVTGMWHGSTITFIVWGMIYFVLQAIEKYTKISSFLNKIHMGHIYTLFFVIITWVIFKSESLPFAYNYIKAMFSFGGTFCTKLDISELSHYTLILVLGIIFSTDVGCKIKNLASNNKTIEFIYNSVIIVLFVISAILLLGKGMTAPLYAKF